MDLKEVDLLADTAGCPLPWEYKQDRYRISITHQNGWSLALVSTSTRPGIDLENVVTQSDAIVRRALTESEQLWLQEQAPRDEWLTRLWVAKEAVGKSTGDGLSYSPRSLLLDTQHGERFQVAGRWVETRREQKWVVGWTQPIEGR